MNNDQSKMSMEPDFRVVGKFGAREELALEFDAGCGATTVWNECWGSIGLWAGGLPVGNQEETEMVMIALSSLEDAARESRTELSSALAGLSSQEALDLVMWARYGTADSPPVEAPLISEEALSSLEILPRRTGPSFDGWEAILLERGAKEHFIYRREGGELHEAVWPIGRFRNVVDQAIVEFERLARAVVKESPGGF